MIYRVFLDTNIYDAANYSFRNASFSRLRSLAEAGHLQLIMNSVIEGEVRSHISERVKKAVKELERATREPVFAGFRKNPDYQKQLSITDSSEWVNCALDDFIELLNSCCVRRIPLNGIDVETMLEDYFQQKYPFEKKKPDEFKDAIAVRSLTLDMAEADSEPDIIQYCIVSADKGFREAIKNAISGKMIEDYTLIFDSLVAFTDYLAELDSQMQFMLRYLKSDYGHDLLYDAVKEALEASTFEIKEFNEVTDQDIVDIDVVSAIPHTISLTNTAGTPDVLETVIEGEADIVVDYTYNDVNQSYYDKELGEYIYLVSVSATATHRIRFNIPMSFIVNECLAENEELESEDDEVFDSKEMELDVYTEQSFDLSEENRTSYEELERSDNDTDDDTYDTCPDCGCRIGIDNDGGNGFCINCAPNH